ncbi:hypothetical protein LshimejAT787_0301500 [Lyophyllum shimeji]|uniref:Uncharacterized protein n=1 Tax=Lyophyllum shimeji TaxID=47721 RepID=A0A9P3UJX8_LYOSH|nr:hypothetical protein LshimejAT787_0301500 [Lyophyllum shimeji]
MPGRPPTWIVLVTLQSKYPGLDALVAAGFLQLNTVAIREGAMQSSNSQPFHPLSEDLIALSTLTPPSPILSPTHLTTAWSWSEFPVELDLDADDVASEQPLSAVHAGAHTATGFEIRSIPSASTVCTVGTFGPICKEHKCRDAGSWSPISQHLEKTHVARLSAKDVPDIICSPWRALRATSPMPLIDDQEPMTPSKLAATASTLHFVNGVAPRSTKSHLSLSSLSLDSPADDGGKGSFELPHLDSLSSSSSPLSGSCESCPTTGRSIRTRAAFTDDNGPVDALTRQLAFAATLATLESKCYSAPASPQGPRITPLADNRHAKGELPESLAWLANTVVEAMIDQEGFRGVLARFKYTGYVSPGSLPARREYGTVQFRPVKRQIFNFHYAALEGLPVLRRITLNGEETRDYISRQASLSLKANGVYFVRGRETSSFPVPPTRDEETTAEPRQLQWRFEYMVGDRRSEAPGKKIVDGEKVLTPLSFSCSPLLLHPLQGKRIRLMHVVKKSVIAKLVAEKMEPPGPRPRVNSPTKTEETRSHMDHAPGLRTKSHTWSIHKRSATHCTPRDNELKSVDESLLPASRLVQTAPPREKVGSQSPRRRRASSAGECNRPGRNFLSPYARHGNSPLCQNIVPRSHLAALVAAEASPRNTGPAVTTPRISMDASFRPLSPCPRHHQSPIRADYRPQNKLE